MSQLAWNSITPAMRRLHVGCLRDLRAMPEELLRFDLPQAVVELVRRQAVARRWKWATVAKRLSAMAGALRDLPLYTNQREGVDLRRCPEWVAATKRVRALAQIAPTCAPTPVRECDVQRARAELQHTSPEASLLLGLLWALAARASDVTTLQKRDLRLADLANAEGRYPIAVMMRRGKGAKMRGPYCAKATLSRADASALTKLMTQRRSKQVLFRRCGELCALIRSALREREPGAALPSVRKGAMRALASGGTPTATLMRLAGHTRLQTLERYLGFGLPPLRKEG